MEKKENINEKVKSCYLNMLHFKINESGFPSLLLLTQSQSREIVCHQHNCKNEYFELFTIISRYKHYTFIQDVYRYNYMYIRASLTPLVPSFKAFSCRQRATLAFVHVYTLCLLVSLSLHPVLTIRAALPFNYLNYFISFESNTFVTHYPC